MRAVEMVEIYTGGNATRAYAQLGHGGWQSRGDRDAAIAVEIDHLVIAPAERQVVEDDVVGARLPRAEAAELERRTGG